jgi:hypothetical protein
MRARPAASSSLDDPTAANNGCVMKTTVRPPAPPIADDPSAEGRARRWPWLVGALAVVLAIVASVGVAWVANIEPLGPGSTAVGPGGVRIFIPSPAPRVRSDGVDGFGVSGTVLRIPATPGLRFRYQVTIRNDGIVPVEVVDVGSDSEPGQVTRHVVAAQPDHPGGDSTTPNRSGRSRSIRARRLGSSWRSAWPPIHASPGPDPPPSGPGSR